MVATLKVTPAANGKNGQATASAASSDMAGMPGMSNSSGTSGSSGSADVSTMKPGSAAANKMNAEMEKAMTGGVNRFLAYAKKYAAGNIKTANTRLRPTVLADGTKDFDLTAAITDWEVEPGQDGQGLDLQRHRCRARGSRSTPATRSRSSCTNKLPISHRHPLPRHRRAQRPGRRRPDHPGATSSPGRPTPTPSPLRRTRARHVPRPHARPGGHRRTACSPCSRSVTWRSPKGRTIAGVNIPADLKVTQEIPMVLNDAGVIGLSLNGKASRPPLRSWPSRATGC